MGIGDCGVGGVDISVGKLMIYTVAGGINPEQVLPVVIDAGTNRKELLEDPLYLGNRHTRVRGEQYDKFIDKFVQTSEKLFPRLYLHWEDFGRSNAARILDRYKNTYAVVNDDVQGTAIVSLAGILGGLKISGKSLDDQIYLCFGAGSDGAGIVDLVYKEMISCGISEDDARKKFYMFDKQGLLFDDMDDLTEKQKPFARKRNEFENPEEMRDLLKVVEKIKPTILVGTSTQSNSFTKEIVEMMCKNTERPIIFPLSNPTKLMEEKQMI